MLRVDVHVLDHDGNLTDAAGLAALAALMAFRRPYVEVGGGSSEQDQVKPPSFGGPDPLATRPCQPVSVCLQEG